MLQAREQAIRPAPARLRVSARYLRASVLSWLAAIVVLALVVLLAAPPGWPVPLPVLATAALAVLPAASVFALWRLMRANRELRSTVAAFEAQERAMREQGAAAAHDLRSPLMTARSYMEMMVEEAFGPLPAAAREAALRAAQASSRAQSIAESALAPSSACEFRDGGSIVNLNAVVDDVVSSLAADFHEVGARIRVAPLPRVLAEESSLYRVFENLILNSVRYHRPGVAPRIEVTSPASEGGIRVAIRDWGIGIPSADRERVFGVGVRGEVASTRSDGRGLGLPTVRRLMTQLGGDVWIDADVDRGTRVLLEFPCS